MSQIKAVPTPSSTSNTTLCGRTKATIRRLAEEVDSIVTQAKQARLDAEAARLEAFVREATARIGQIQKLAEDIAGFLEASEMARLKVEKERLEAAVREIADRRASVEATRKQTAGLLAANGWTH
ncbi:MAG: hypothetical protein AAGI30_10160 [Planctomycetota bacterium]